MTQPSPPTWPTRLGRYVLSPPIGSGGGGTVHIACADGANAVVALKRLRPSHDRGSDLAAALIDEARISRSLKSPSLVRVDGVRSEGGEMVLVSEYVHGDSVRGLLAGRATHGGLDPAIVATITCAILEGLDAAHEARGPDGVALGLIHRDVSPHNVLVDVHGRTKLMDFGVAKARGRAQTTRAHEIKGKVAYMAPEQLEGRPLDRRADIFSAGVVLWELLTGTRVFRVGLGPTRTPATRVERQPGPLGKLIEVALTALAHDPGGRFSTARDMAAAIGSCGVALDPSKVGRWVAATRASELAERERWIAALVSRAELAPPTKGVLAPSAEDTRSDQVSAASKRTFGGSYAFARTGDVLLFSTARQTFTANFLADLSLELSETKPRVLVALLPNTMKVSNRMREEVRKLVAQRWVTLVEVAPGKPSLGDESHFYTPTDWRRTLVSHRLPKACTTEANALLRRLGAELVLA